MNWTVHYSQEWFLTDTCEQIYSPKELKNKVSNLDKETQLKKLTKKILYHIRH